MKVLIVEDHSLYRDGLRHLVQQLGEKKLEVLEAGTGHEALAMVARHPDLDLVLLDIKLPDIDGFVAMQRFLDAQPTLPMVVLSASEDLEDMSTALDRGAMGYIPKNTPPAVMLSAIQLVLSGGVYVPPEMLRNHILRRRDANGGARALTERQREVLELLCQGKTNKAIGSALGLSLATVKAHVSAVFKGLKVRNRAEALAVAKRPGPAGRERPG